MLTENGVLDKGEFFSIRTGQSITDAYLRPSPCPLPNGARGHRSYEQEFRLAERVGHAPASWWALSLLAEMQNQPSFIGRFRPTPPFSWPATVVFWYVGVALPIFCFAITLHEAPDMPTWQAGNAADIAALLLTGRTSFYLFPFLIHAVIAFSLLLLWPARFCQQFLLRWGVYSGVLLALHFSIALAFTLGAVTTVYSWRAVTLPLTMLSMTTIPIWLGWWLLCWIARRLNLADRLRSLKSRLVLSAIVVAAVAVIIAYCAQADVQLGEVIFFNCYVSS